MWLVCPTCMDGLFCNYLEECLDLKVSYFFRCSVKSFSFWLLALLGQNRTDSNIWSLEVVRSSLFFWVVLACDKPWLKIRKLVIFFLRWNLFSRWPLVGLDSPSADSTALSLKNMWIVCVVFILLRIFSWNWIVGHVFHCIICGRCFDVSL